MSEKDDITTGKMVSVFLAIGAIVVSIVYWYGQAYPGIEPEEVPPCICETPKEPERPTTTDNIRIPELDMLLAGWEGQLWTDAEGKNLGLAVRKTDVELGPRLGFNAGVKTDWGYCSSWSKHSPGKYCLIKIFWLSDIGLNVYEMFSSPYVYDALP